MVDKIKELFCMVDKRKKLIFMVPSRQHKDYFVYWAQNRALSLFIFSLLGT